ncbi:MAG: hypothetical protein WBG69_08180 [Arcobacteraceae bacterium]
MKTTNDIKALIRDGANLKIPATKTIADLKSIAKEAKLANTHLTITDASKKTTADLRALVAIYPSGITIELN